MEPITIPDLSSRPFNLEVERTIQFSPEPIFNAWTKHFDRWFASEGSLIMQAEVNSVFFFETFFEGARHPHYGRFLKVDQDRLLEFTWVNGAGGTLGSETIVTIELEPHENGTKIRLTHAGFNDRDTRDHHEEAWISILEYLENKMPELI